MKLNNILKFEKAKFEKANMNKIRYIINYFVVPIYALITLICLVMVGVLMEIDEHRYTPIAIGLFIFIGVMTFSLLVSIPLTRKLEIKAEIKRYDFDTSNIESNGIYDFSNEEVSLRFDENGIYINDTLFWYNHLKVFINTSNHLNCVWVSIIFYINETNYYDILLCGKIINMIEKFNINLLNRESFDYIINHKEEAFTKIYKTGQV